MVGELLMHHALGMSIAERFAKASRSALYASMFPGPRPDLYVRCGLCGTETPAGYWHTCGRPPKP